MSTNDPLIIIDGIPGSLTNVDTEDIETITVLKDASAASIYGARAAAGVILITTKRAKSGSFSLNYKYEFGLDTPTGAPKMSDAVTYMNLFNEQKWNDGAEEYGTYRKDYIDSYMSNNAIDPIHYPNTDWLGLVMKKTTSHQRHSVNVSSGSERIRTMATFNYNTADGYYKGKKFDSYSGRVNNDFKITDWMNATVDLDYYYSSSKNNSYSDVFGVTSTLPPIYTPYWENGDYADVKDGCNILAAVEQGGTNKSENYAFIGKAKLEVTPVKGLTLTALVAPKLGFSIGKTFQKNVDSYYEDGRVCTVQYAKGTELSESRGNSHQITYQAFANYQGKWEWHSLNAMAGYEGYTYYHETLSAKRTNYTLKDYPYLDLGPADFQYNNGSAGHNAYQSVFGRLIYSFKDRYLIQASARYDGSSRFSKSYRWGLFPSVSFGWVISDEPWFNNKGVINYLKLRGSIGQLGNERLGSDFPYQAAMSFSNAYFFDKAAASVTAVQTAAQIDYAYDDLSWETTTTYGVGLDASFFKNRLTVSLDGYHKKTTGMLLEVGFPAYYGYSSPQANAGDMYTDGYDIELGWKDRIGDFSYGISANLSDYRSRMGYLGDKKTVSGNYLYEEGSYYKEWYIYRADGLFVTDADLIDPSGKPYPSLQGVNKAGFVKYLDVAGAEDGSPDGKINSEDKVKHGNSLPEYLYGGNIFLGWKNLDFNLSFQGIGHRQVLFNTSWIQPFSGSWRAVPQELVGNYWSKYNTDEQNAKVKYPALTSSYTSSVYTASDYWLFNGAYFRVKNIQLGYTLPDNVAHALKMKNVRVYFNVTDLPAFSKYPKGYDPELGSFTDYFSTSYILGLNVKF